MSITHSYVDYGAGNDTTGDGTVGTPWKTLQKAFDTLTRNTTDGNQVNLKAGTAHVNSATLDLTTFIGGGALSATAPLILRGYTSAANDGGIGEIDCGGATMFAATTYDYVGFIDLEMHTFGDNAGIYLRSAITFIGCEIHKGASTPNNKQLVRVTTGNFSRCYIHDTNTSGTGIYASGSVLISGCYFVNSQSQAVYCLGTGAIVENCIFLLSAGIAINCVISMATIRNNALYSTAANTARGIYTGGFSLFVYNNIIVGWSGTGGDAIEATDVTMLGYNAFYNNTNNNTISGDIIADLTANDVSLAADPFTDAANGDFSLTDAAKTALRSLGWPASYLGAHANTDPHITIGPMQYGPTPAAAGGGFPILGGSVVR